MYLAALAFGLVNVGMNPYSGVALSTKQVHRFLASQLPSVAMPIVTACQLWIPAKERAELQLA